MLRFSKLCHIGLSICTSIFLFSFPSVISERARYMKFGEYWFGYVGYWLSVPHITYLIHWNQQGRSVLCGAKFISCWKQWWYVSSLKARSTAYYYFGRIILEISNYLEGLVLFQVFLIWNEIRDFGNDFRLEIFKCIPLLPYISKNKSK